MESTNAEVADFLEHIKSNAPDQFELLQWLREMVFEAFPNVTETFKYGGIMLTANDGFGGLFVYKSHISFEFSYGYKLTSALPLEGKGKYRRHLKFKALHDIDEKELKVLFAQIKVLDEG